jgi:hypothetical protein
VTIFDRSTPVAEEVRVERGAPRGVGGSSSTYSSAPARRAPAALARDGNIEARGAIHEAARRATLWSIERLRSVRLKRATAFTPDQLRVALFDAVAAGGSRRPPVVLIPKEVQFGPRWCLNTITRTD